MTVRRGRAAKGQISLVHAPFAEHGGKPLEGLRGLGEDHYAAYRPVEPVRQAHEHLSRLSVAHGYERFQGFAERLVPAAVALHYFAAALVHYQYVIVLVQYSFLQTEELRLR